MANLGDKLTGKQQRFVDEYLIDLNASAAYKRAGYAGRGATADVNASKLLRTAKIAKHVADRQSVLMEKTQITQERVLAEYAKLAFLDPRKFYDKNGDLVPIHELDDDTAAAIAGMDVVENRGEGGRIVDYTKKIKIIDKKGALDSISRTLGMFKEKVEHSGPEGGPIPVASVNVSDLSDKELESFAKILGKLQK